MYKLLLKHKNHIITRNPVRSRPRKYTGLFTVIIQSISNFGVLHVISCRGSRFKCEEASVFVIESRVTVPRSSKVIPVRFPVTFCSTRRQLQWWWESENQNEQINKLKADNMKIWGMRREAKLMCRGHDKLSPFWTCDHAAADLRAVKDALQVSRRIVRCWLLLVFFDATALSLPSWLTKGSCLGATYRDRNCLKVTVWQLQ